MKVNLIDNPNSLWFDKDTFAVSFPCDIDYADKNNILNAWLDVKWHEDKKQMVYTYTTENIFGSCESINVENELDTTTKIRIDKIVNKLKGE